VINREISRILEGDVPRDELEMMREYLTGGILLGAESGDNRMMRLAKNEYVFNRYISFDELIENLKKVEVDDIVRVAETCFKTGDVALVTLGPIDRDSLKEDFLLFH
jgi:predicted Zn-dependent peptidase